MSFDQLRSANAKRAALYPANGKFSVLFRAVELGGEVGELLNLIKKRERAILGGGGTVDMAPIADELADVVICADLLAMDLGIAVETKFNKTSDKVGLPVRYCDGEVEE